MRHLCICDFMVIRVFSNGCDCSWKLWWLRWRNYFITLLTSPRSSIIMILHVYHFLISSVLISSIADIIYAIKASGIDSITMPNIHLLLNSLLTVSLSTILLMLHRYHYHYFFFIRIICNRHLFNHNITVVFHHNNLQHNICWCISLLSFPCFFRLHDVLLQHFQCISLFNSK